MDSIKVSVIVPCWNAGRTIRKCLDSLTKQTLKDIEIICIDDGSEDDTFQNLKEYARKSTKIRAFSNGADLGQGFTVNRGVDLATGMYIAECDSDDWVEPDMYEQLYEVAESNSFPDAVRCGIYEEFADRIAQNHMCCDFLDGEVLRPKEETEELWPAIYGRQCSIPSGIFRKDFIRKNKLFYRRGHNFDDTSLEFKIRASAKTYVMTKRLLYHYNRANEHSGSSTIKDVYAICEQVAEMMRFNAERSLGLDAYINAYRYYLYMWNLSRLSSDQDIKAFAERMRHDFRFNPADPKFFNNESDWKNYCEIRGF